jgi:cytochrome c oxidase accessory protein FixG
MPSEGAIEKAKDFRDKISNVDHDTGKRLWIYAKKPFGKLYNLRKYVSYVYLLFFFGAPFIKSNGNPLLMINVVEGKFSILGKMFWPQDFFIFGLGMLIFIIFIILFTLVFGRVFCGWVCPQTIFMEMVFRRIEYAIEGDAGKQKVLDRQQWNSEKILKKTVKHFLFFVFSFLIANTFLAYILGIEKMQDMISHPVANIGVLIGLLIFTFVFYAVYAYIRETVCTNICPYGRLQGVLMDKDSIIVAYDHVRGEGRAKFSKNRDENLGDCIDCHQCVDVCPTGIDIRNGTQLECINCTACIDACNHMMESVGYEKNLIRYASENSIQQKKKLTVTSRIKVFSAILLVLIGIMSFTLMSRKDLNTTILRTAGKLYYEMENDTIGNLYSLKIINKTTEDINLKLVPNAKNASIKMAGEVNPIIPKAAKKDLTFFILYHSNDIKKRKQEIDVNLIMNGEKKQSVTTIFIGPMNLE